MNFTTFARLLALAACLSSTLNAHAGDVTITYGSTSPASCPAQPATATRTVTCPAGYTGQWTQTSVATSVAAPTCWAQGTWLPGQAPGKSCVALPKSPAETPPAPTVGYIKCAAEDAVCKISTPGLVIYGAGSKYTKPVQLSADTVCNNAVFTDPDFGVTKACWFKANAPATVNHAGTIFIDKTKIPVPVTFNDVDAYGGHLLQSGEHIEAVPRNPNGSVPTQFQTVVSDIGAFRTYCSFAKMAFDDPLVYPGQPGASHLHTFVGALGIDAFATGSNIRSAAMLAKGSTCAGGSGANNSGYWFPAMIDTLDGTPKKPSGELTYYKGSYAIPNNDIKALPVGLRMIAGNALNVNPAGAEHTRYTCIAANGTNLGWKQTITAAYADGTCNAGADFIMEVTFPTCWDGVNLDSPNHNSHMSDPETYLDHYTSAGNAAYLQRCPASHPVHIPTISYNVHYAVADTKEVSRWRLSSDAYDSTLPAGLSGHGDYMLGWNPAVMQVWLSKCLQSGVDCHTYLLGDGTFLQ